jgi:cytochrome c-type biogenesis protein CcmH/NrfG
MEAVRTRRERVAVGFFAVVTISVTLLTGYRLLAGASPGPKADHREDQSAALEKKATALEASLRTKPEDVRGLISLGDTYLDLRDGARALPIFERAERIAPGDAHVQTDLGNLYQQMGRLDVALEKFSRALQLDPSHAGVLLSIAIVHQAQGNRDKARGTLHALLAKNPEPQLADAARKLLAKIEGEHGNE